MWLRSYLPGALVLSSEAVGLVATFIPFWLSLDALELISGVFLTLFKFLPQSLGSAVILTYQ